MVRTDFLPKQRQERDHARHAGALAVSCIFHATLFGLLIWLAIYHMKWTPRPSGSKASLPSMTLSTLVMTTPPPCAPPSPSPKIEKPVATTSPANPVAPPHQPAIPPSPIPAAVPVLAAQEPKAVMVEAPNTVSHQAKTAATTTSITKAESTQPKSAMPTSFASSYAPGENVLPHPPYPPEAQNLGETGTVLMAVTFNTAGDVTQAEVAQSSGVRLLDTTTRSFILTHWHSATLAGRTMMQPVRYTGE